MNRPSSALRVLVVDDEPLIRWSITETLRQSGHIVGDAADGAGALRAVEDGPLPDVILLDVRLPDSGDLTLLSAIRRLAPSAAVVMMTAAGTPELTASAERLGAHTVIGKPIDMFDLDAIVQAASAARSGPPE